MSRDQDKPLRLFVDPFAAWRELAFKTAEMIAASAHAGAASASRRVRVAVIDERPSPSRPARKASRKKTPRKRARHR